MVHAPRRAQRDTETQTDWSGQADVRVRSEDERMNDQLGVAGEVAGEGNGEPTLDMEGPEVNNLAGPIYYADNTLEPFYLEEEEEEEDIYHPGLATPPSPISTNSDSGNDEPVISIQELEAERMEEFNDELRDWLNDYTA